jgi:phosphoserine phosphatase
MPNDLPLANAHAGTLVRARPLALTLVAGEGEDIGTLREHARQALDEAGTEIGAERGLSPTAFEQSLHGRDDLVRSHMRAALSGRVVDWCLQPAPVRPRRLLLCDMDSTIISCECIDEIAAILGIKAEIAEITEKAMRGEMAFEEALVARVRRLAGVRERDLERIYAERVRLNPGAATLTATMHAHGALCVLVSGGFTFFTERVAAAAGFDAHHANQLAMNADALTGEVVPPILGQDAKREALLAHAAEIGAEAGDALAIGDGANDLAMLTTAGLGVAYRAKPVLDEAAAGRIASGDLRSALYFQGIAADAFVERG